MNCVYYHSYCIVFWRAIAAIVCVCVCVCVCVIISVYLQNHWLKIVVSKTEKSRNKTLLNKIIVMLAVRIIYCV